MRDNRADYHPDQLGSIRALTDGSGTVQNTYQYDAYGTTTSSTGSVSNPFRYAGEYLDSESGLYYLRARYYDPATQQFLTRDPLAALTGTPYAYANGSPLNESDPSGLANKWEPGEFGDRVHDLLEAEFWYKMHGGVSDAGWGGPIRWWNQVCEQMQDRLDLLQTLQALSDAAAAPDRNGFTSAGRALQKHSNRAGSAWQKYKPSSQTAQAYNEAAQDLVDDILTDPGHTVSTHPWSDNGKVIQVTDIKAPDGRGLRYRNTDGSFVGFLEP